MQLMRSLTELSLLLSFSVFLGALAVAEPVVIHDSGHTQPLKHPGVTNQQLQSTPVKPRDMSYRRVPVVTTSLSPGRVQSRAGKYPYLSFPIFIVGYDPFSLTWLREHQEKLKQYSALGLAVNVQTERQIGLLQEAAGGIKIAPVSGAKIANDLSIKHYPVLVSRTMIEQ